jgi:hypothetical protein
MNSIQQNIRSKLRLDFYTGLTAMNAPKLLLSFVTNVISIQV